MTVNIKNTDNKKRFTVTSAKPNSVVVKKSQSKNIKLNITKDGLSAYELAVRNGYTGSESEFAAESIHPLIDFTAYYIISKS